MKFAKFSLPLTLSLFALLSCSEPVFVQKDPSVSLSNYHTYMWVETKANDQDNSARPTAYIDMSMRDKVNKELEKKGWKEVSENPDVLISYDVLVERSVEQRSDPVYTQPFTRLFYSPFSRRWVTIYYPSNFVGYETYQVPVKEGTITITMVDAKTDKVVWQGWKTEQLNYSTITDKEIAKSVSNILRKLA